MKRETEKLHDEQRRIGVYRDGLQAKINALPAHAFGRLQSASVEGLSALMPSIFDKAFKGEM